MSTNRTYVIRCRGCDYQRSVPEPDLHRALCAVAGEGHKLTIPLDKSAGSSGETGRYGGSVVRGRTRLAQVPQRSRKGDPGSGGPRRSEWTVDTVVERDGTNGANGDEIGKTAPPTASVG